MEYLVDGHKYILHYQALRETYLRFCDMTDDVFLANLPSATHLAVIICYLKEIPSCICLSDRGIVHELVHLMDIPDTNKFFVQRVRDLFKTQLQLSA